MRLCGSLFKRRRCNTCLIIIIIIETQKTMQKHLAALTETIQKSAMNTETKATLNKEKFDKSEKTCFLCHKSGHIRSNCPKLPKKTKSTNDDGGAVARSVSSRDSSIDNANRRSYSKCQF